MEETAASALVCWNSWVGWSIRLDVEAYIAALKVTDNLLRSAWRPIDAETNDSQKSSEHQLKGPGMNVISKRVLTVSVESSWQTVLLQTENKDRQDLCRVLRRPVNQLYLSLVGFSFASMTRQEGGWRSKGGWPSQDDYYEDVGSGKQIYIYYTW